MMNRQERTQGAATCLRREVNRVTARILADDDSAGIVLVGVARDDLGVEFEVVLTRQLNVNQAKDLLRALEGAVWRLS